ncbi:hypothetical protein LX32DRAFT_178708 [Colletotrichum zoysiae]|uniref:Uncharacterized protein n=1 Tax=Colletotrichum zoysiae TaxID=1216348 RepID=A0AAD9H7G1_9PEZI|nr:hypothetical protein LX32DRAFT_178708 [Colletotrichum zoysiae]
MAALRTTTPMTRQTEESCQDLLPSAGRSWEWGRMPISYRQAIPMLSLVGAGYPGVRRGSPGQQAEIIRPWLPKAPTKHRLDLIHLCNQNRRFAPPPVFTSLTPSTATSRHSAEMKSPLKCPVLCCHTSAGTGSEWRETAAAKLQCQTMHDAPSRPRQH